MAADFPAFIPSAPKLAAGEWRSNLQTSASGGTSIVTTGTLERGRRLPLEFPALTLAEAMQIINHYKAALSTVDTFQFSPTTLAAGYTPAGMGWIYAGPPEVDDRYADIHRVSCEFECVPLLAAVMPGRRMVIQMAFSGCYVIGEPRSPLGGGHKEIEMVFSPGVQNVLPQINFEFSPPPSPVKILPSIDMLFRSSGLGVGGFHDFVGFEFRVASEFDTHTEIQFEFTPPKIFFGGFSANIDFTFSFAGVIETPDPVLLLRYSGSVGSTAIVDESIHARTVTNTISGTGEAGKIQALNVGYTKSYLCVDPANISNQAYLQLASGTHWEFPGEYRIHIWFRQWGLNSVSTTNPVAQIGSMSTGATGIRIHSEASGVSVRIKTASYDVTITGPVLALNQDHYLVITRNAANLVTCAVNGSIIGTPQTMTGTHGRIGVGGATHFGGTIITVGVSEIRGYLGEVVVVKGQSTSNFSVPTTPWPYL